MSQIDVIRAWKDPEYRLSLTDEERSALPENPAGSVELNGDQLKSVHGGLGPIVTTAITCTQYTWFDWKACCR